MWKEIMWLRGSSLGLPSKLGMSEEILVSIEI
jgi:hypothetical protein